MALNFHAFLQIRLCPLCFVLSAACGSLSFIADGGKELNYDVTFTAVGRLFLYEENVGEATQQLLNAKME